MIKFSKPHCKLLQDIVVNVVVFHWICKIRCKKRFICVYFLKIPCFILSKNVSLIRNHNVRIINRFEVGKLSSQSLRIFIRSETRKTINHSNVRNSWTWPEKKSVRNWTWTPKSNIKKLWILGVSKALKTTILTYKFITYRLQWKKKIQLQPTWTKTIVWNNWFIFWW